MAIKILYEDNHIIAVIKLSGVLTQGDRSGSWSLMDDVKKYLKEKYKKPGNVFLGLVHRLDKPVSGIVLFGKTSKGAARLSEQFRNHTIQKTYHGIVMGKLEKEKGEIKEKVKKISFFAEGFTEKSDEELLAEIKKATKTRTAELSYEVLKSNGKYSLIKIMPKTGRFHQIRIQMANMGHPILGDFKYGYKPALSVKQYCGPVHGTKLLCDKQNHRTIHRTVLLCDKNSIALCATAISFKTATLQQIQGKLEEKTINLSIPLPKEWKNFV